MDTSANSNDAVEDLGKAASDVSTQRGSKRIRSTRDGSDQSVPPCRYESISHEQHKPCAVKPQFEDCSVVTSRFSLITFFCIGHVGYVVSPS